MLVSQELQHRANTRNLQARKGGINAETTTRILLVEDHKLIAEMMYSELAVMTNCVVDVVHDADEAESRSCQGQRYDVVLLDYVLPGSIDLDVFEGLKELNNGGVVLFSRVADASVVELAISMGAAGIHSEIDRSSDIEAGYSDHLEGRLLFPNQQHRQTSGRAEPESRTEEHRDAGACLCR